MKNLTPENPNDQLKNNAWTAFATLLASSGTLICCVLPAVMVSLGAGASLAGLVSTFPQLIWLSEHKGLVFGFAFFMLAFSGLTLYRARSLPCPADPKLAASCTRLRKFSWTLWGVALALTIMGAVFAFILPRI